MAGLLKGNTEQEAVKSFFNLCTSGSAEGFGPRDILQEVGRYYDAERAVVFEHNEDGLSISNTMEWCAEGVAAKADGMQNLPRSEMQSWAAAFQKYGGFYMVNDGEFAQESPVISTMMKASGVDSLMAAPLTLQGQLAGFLGVDNPKAHTDQALLLAVMADSLFKEILHQRETDLLRKQHKLQSDFEHILEAVDSAQMGVWGIWGLEGDRPGMTATRQGLSILGLSEDELKGSELFSYWWSRIASESLDDVVEMSRGMMAGELAQGTYAWEHPGRGTVYLRFGGKGITTSWGSPFIQGYVFDITREMVRSKDSQRKQEETMLALREALKDAEKAKEQALQENEIISCISKQYFALYSVNLVDDRFEGINSTSLYTDMTGLEGSAQAMLVATIPQVVAPEYQELVREFTNLGTASDRLRGKDILETEYLAVDGNWLRASVIPQKHDAEGNVSHVLYAVRLVSAEKQQELEQERLRIAYEAAERANEAKTSFLFNMSHDIRTPMNAILGYARLLRKGLTDPQMLDYQAKMEQSGEFLLSLLNNVLDMARIESGKMELDENYCRAGDNISEVIRVFEMAAKEKDIVLEHRVRSDHPHILCDIIKVQEVFTNLISNAIKYTAPGGRISIVTEELPSGEADYILMHTVVEDTGIGMSEDFLPHLFDSFTRERNTTLGKVAGTGLGMPIVKELVELMGGTIEVESALGVGTKFVIVIPHKLAPEEYYQSTTASQAKGEEAFATLKGKRVLLAEDNDLNAEIAVAILEEMGMEIDRVEDGVLCVDRLEHKPAGTYDLVLMDVQMPNMDGYKATAVIRSLPDQAKAGIPIVAMTANAFEEDRRKALAMGMNGHVAKPIDVPKMVETLASSLG